MQPHFQASTYLLHTSSLISQVIQGIVCLLSLPAHSMKCILLKLPQSFKATGLSSIPESFHAFALSGTWHSILEYRKHSHYQEPLPIVLTGQGRRPTDFWILMRNTCSQQVLTTVYYPAEKLRGSWYSLLYNLPGPDFFRIWATNHCIVFQKAFINTQEPSVLEEHKNHSWIAFLQVVEGIFAVCHYQ